MAECPGVNHVSHTQGSRKEPWEECQPRLAKGQDQKNYYLLFPYLKDLTMAVAYLNIFSIYNICQHRVIYLVYDKNLTYS